LLSSDSKSPFPCESVGSIPTSGTKEIQRFATFSVTNLFSFSSVLHGLFCQAILIVRELFLIFFNTGDLLGQFLLLFEVALTGNHDALGLG